MASIRKEAAIAAPAAAVWAALRDVGALHTRLVAGFVTDCRLEGDTRVVTFANGMVARERIVTVDDAERRVVWSATGDRLAHHNASAQVFDEGDGATACRVVWVCDLLPDAMASPVAAMIEAGLSAMQRTLGGAADASVSRGGGTS